MKDLNILSLKNSFFFIISLKIQDKASEVDWPEPNNDLFKNYNKKAPDLNEPDRA